MEQNELMHYGIKGMKWGVRRTEAQLARARGSSRYDILDKSTPVKSSSRSSSSSSEKKSIKDMSEDELRKKVNRLELEKRYKDLTKATEEKKVNKGKQFVGRVLERAGENIATQFATYVLGTATNKAFAKIFKDEKIVNPKKGQKD